MRILMISDVYFPRVNGVSTSIRTFRRELLALGHKVTLIAPAYPTPSVDEDGDIVRIPSRGVWRDPEDRMMQRRSIDGLLPQLAQQDYDVVHIHTPFVAHYAGVALAQKLNLPVIESYHTFFEEYLYHYVPFVPRSLMRMLARRVTVSQCRAVDRLISPSRAMLAALTAYGVQTAIDVLPTGLDAKQFRLGDGARFREKYGIPADRPTLLYVGRVAHEKNIDFLLQMFAHVLIAIPNALLIIAGEGPAREHLRVQARRLRQPDAVMFIGYLDRETELLDCYRAGDLFVFASRTETQGLVLLEAMAQGTPVVSTMHMGTRDVLEHARGVQLVDEDEVAFARATTTLLGDAPARKQLSQLAPLDAAKWSARDMAERLLKTYSNTVAQRRQPETAAQSSTDAAT
jgi:glycosyltransferase involved in cell wall biosynthesis